MLLLRHKGRLGMHCKRPTPAQRMSEMRRRDCVGTGDAIASRGIRSACRDPSETRGNEDPCREFANHEEGAGRLSAGAWPEERRGCVSSLESEQALRVLREAPPFDPSVLSLFRKCLCLRFLSVSSDQNVTARSHGTGGDKHYGLAPMVEQVVEADVSGLHTPSVFRNGEFTDPEGAALGKRPGTEEGRTVFLSSSAIELRGEPTRCQRCKAPVVSQYGTKSSYFNYNSGPRDKSCQES